jgi:hypothetical protein
MTFQRALIDMTANLELPKQDVAYAYRKFGLYHRSITNLGKKHHID